MTDESAGVAGACRGPRRWQPILAGEAIAIAEEIAVAFTLPPPPDGSAAFGRPPDGVDHSLSGGSAGPRLPVSAIPGCRGA